MLPSNSVVTLAAWLHILCELSAMCHMWISLVIAFSTCQTRPELRPRGVFLARQDAREAVACWRSESIGLFPNVGFYGATFLAAALPAPLGPRLLSLPTHQAPLLLAMPARLDTGVVASVFPGRSRTSLMNATLPGRNSVGFFPNYASGPVALGGGSDSSTAWLDSCTMVRH